MAQRLVRAKAHDQSGADPVSGACGPSAGGSGSGAVYLIFDEGYDGRDELAAEAIWLGRALSQLVPDDPETRGLRALMLLHDSCRETRFRDGELVLLGDQDPSRWNTAQIAAGRAELDRALALGGRRPHVLPAAIASLHADMPFDWAQIAALYGRERRRRTRFLERRSTGPAATSDRRSFTQLAENADAARLS